MNDAIDLLCLDCAMRNLGMVLLRYDLKTASTKLLDMKLISTESEAGKTVRKNSDDLRRARELYAAINSWEQRSDVVAAEIPSGAQSARASFGFGMAVGVLASIRKPLIQVQPTESKKCVTGRKNASKEEMIEFAMKQYPTAKWLVRKLHGQLVPIDANEHLADACAIGHAAITGDQFRGMVALGTTRV